MSEFIDALTDYREQYISKYQRATVEYREKYKPSAAEVLFEFGGRENLPYLFRLYRADLASGAVEPPNLTEFNLDEIPAGETITYTIGGVSVELSPLAWNGVEITAPPFDATSPMFETWMSAWIDVDETKESDEFGLGDYIHSVTFPQEASEGSVSFSVDFGSARPEALVELIKVMSGLGATHLLVNSNWLANEPE